MIWQPICTAPRDGTLILTRYHNDVCWEHRLARWNPTTPDDPYPWQSEFNAYPEERCPEWASLEETAYASIEDWLGDIENYSSRAERMTLDERRYACAAWQLATERCEEIVRQWSDMSFAQLHAGEMTEQERRTLKAVLIAIRTQIKSK